MRTHQLTFRFVVTPRRVVWALLALLFLAAPQEGGSSDPSKMTMFYPSPGGEYSKLNVYGQTVLARGMNVSYNKVVLLSTKTPAKLLIGNTLPVPAANEKVRVYGDMLVDGCIGLGAKYRCAW
ncbi:MAG TPA: hypothetical protein DCM05_00910 [Elusimicrobia bacterium]|nr:hypothetical protein [Elusimicrobiota bacterium]